MNTNQLLLVSFVGLCVNLFGMVAMGGHHHVSINTSHFVNRLVLTLNAFGRAVIHIRTLMAMTTVMRRQFRRHLCPSTMNIVRVPVTVMAMVIHTLTQK